MYYTDKMTVPMCTILRHPEGGYTPVLHPSSCPVPQAHPMAISFPDLPRAVQYARDHFGAFLLSVAEECRRAAA